MVVGYDAWAKTTSSNFKVGALVCSLNDSQTKYISFALKHRDMEELCSRICALLEKALTQYRKLNGVYPKYLVFYRDAVGEGQITNLLRVRSIFVCGHRPKTKELLELLLFTFWFNSSFK